MMHNDLCPLCKDYPDNGDYIFVRCSKRTKVRKAVNAWWDLWPTASNNVEELFNGVGASCGSNYFTHLAKDLVVQAFT